jgi:two-component system, NtrC family, sensor histidine kinase KinB
MDYEVLEPRRSFVRQVKLPVQSKEGILLGELVVFHDISEERELEQLREDYTHMLVHDLRSPLTGILNGLAMVRRGLVGTINDAQAQSLDIAYNSGQAMLRMVNTLLDISKMEAGQMTLDRQPCSLYEVVDSALERVVPLAASSNINLENGLPSGLPLVEIDREKIIRVLQNLLDNALKFTPDRGTVRVAGDVNQPAHPGQVVLSVTDTGPGIPEQYRQRIFEKFGQIKDRKVKGTGLGLTFCKLTVEAHTGEIWVESEEGKGSTFLFTLPLTSS